MIIERLGSKVSHDGAYKILYVAFSGYPLEMHLYSDGVKSGCEAAQTMEDALEKNKLSKDFFSKHIESLSDGENCMVIMDEDAERQVRDAIFNSRLNEKIHRAEKQITFHMLDFEAKLAKERKEKCAHLQQYRYEG